MSTFRLLGGAVATAIYSSIVDNQFADQLSRQLQTTVAATGAFDLSNRANYQALLTAAKLNTAAAYKKVPGISAQVISASQWAVKLSYTEAFRVVYYTALGFALLAVISASLVRNTDPAKKNMDKAVFLENEKTAAGGKNLPDDDPA
jgi:hypothetical protein